MENTTGSSLTRTLVIVGSLLAIIAFGDFLYGYYLDQDSRFVLDLKGFFGGFFLAAIGRIFGR
jgi:hypothetical protein